jgi:hypothetical protein
MVQVLDAIGNFGPSDKAAHSHSSPASFSNCSTAARRSTMRLRLRRSSRLNPLARLHPRRGRMLDIRFDNGESSVEFVVGIVQRRFPNGGAWSKFVCPCGRRAQKLRLFEGRPACWRRRISATSPAGCTSASTRTRLRTSAVGSIVKQRDDYRFCRKSAGLMPASGIQFFFSGTGACSSSSLERNSLRIGDLFALS